LSDNASLIGTLTWFCYISSMELRRMAVWVDGAGRVVGQVSQGVRCDAAGRPAAVYVATAVGLLPDACPRFACAKTKVENALAQAGVPAREVSLSIAA